MLLSRTTTDYNLQGRTARTTITAYDDTGVITQQDLHEYAYNERGVRVRQTINGVQTVYLLDLSNPTGYAQVLEEHVDGVLTKTYTLGHDVLAQATAAQVLYLLGDGHGSTRAVYDLAALLADPANPAAAILQRYAYDAYGNLLAGAGLTSTVAAALTNHLYSGEQTDLTGLQYLRARYYSPDSGQFSRLDPFFGNLDDPLSLHKYAYVHGDPVNGIDPSGLAMLSAGMSGALLQDMGYGASIGLGGLMTAANYTANGLEWFAGASYEAARWAPVLGSGIAAYEDFQAGKYGWAAFNAGMGILEVTGIGWGARAVGTAGRYMSPILRRMWAQSASHMVTGAARAYSITHGTSRLFWGTRLAGKAHQLVKSAAGMRGIRLRDYVDDVVLSDSDSFFDIVNGRRTLAISIADMSGDAARQLLVALHELSHAQRASAQGVGKYLGLYNRDDAFRFAEEVAVESEALETLLKSGLNAPRWLVEESLSYIDDYDYNLRML